MQLGFNLSSGVADTLESTSILVHFQTRKSIYTQWGVEMPSLIKLSIKKVIKMVVNSLQLNEWKERRPRKFFGVRVNQRLYFPLSAMYFPLSAPMLS
jgi:hypothetical protein